MQRLRTWDERFRTRDSKERNLKQALGEIERMAPRSASRRTSARRRRVIYRRALDEDLLPGRSIEGVATAAVYAAARQMRPPRSIDEVGARLPGRRDGVQAHLPLHRPRTRPRNRARRNPASYVPRFASELDLDEEVERRARELLTTAEEQALHQREEPRRPRRRGASTPPASSPTRKSPRTRSATSRKSPRSPSATATRNSWTWRERPRPSTRPLPAPKLSTRRPETAG